MAYLRQAFALVLLLAAFSKGKSLIVFSNVFNVLFSAPPSIAAPLAIVTFSLEFNIGIWLLFYPSDKDARLCATVLFAVFSAIQWYRYFADIQGGCSCFGQLQGSRILAIMEHPAYAGTIDTTIALTLFPFYPQKLLRMFVPPPFWRITSKNNNHN